MTPILLGAANPALGLDFIGGRFQLGNGSFSDPSQIPGWSFTRASVGWAKDSQGNDVQFLSGVPRITDLGLLVEESRTNFLLNSTAPATQTTGSLGTGVYTVWVVGSGSAAVTAGTGTATGLGTATAASPVTFTVTVAGTFTVTKTGTLTFFQLENGSGATSRIVTAGATATRAADVPSIAQAGPAAGTLFVQANAMTSDSAFRRAASLNDGTSSNETYIGIASGNAKSFVLSGGATQASFNQSAWSGSAKLATAFAANDFASVQGGGTVSTDAAGTVPTTTAFDIGNLAGSGQFNGYIQRVTLYPTRLTNAQIQALTT